RTAATGPELGRGEGDDFDDLFRPQDDVPTLPPNLGLIGADGHGGRTRTVSSVFSGFSYAVRQRSFGSAQRGRQISGYSEVEHNYAGGAPACPSANYNSGGKRMNIQVAASCSQDRASSSPEDAARVWLLRRRLHLVLNQLSRAVVEENFFTRGALQFLDFA
ncbi:unnamed protein product, partial [Amoebophrya sp. A25]